MLVGGVTRRSFVKGVSAAAAAPRSGGTDADGDTVAVIGGFESGFDGWSGNGASVSRVTDEDVQGAALEGEYALRADAEGAHPSIRRSVRDVSLADKPYLISDVVTVPDGFSSSESAEDILGSEVVFEISLGRGGFFSFSSPLNRILGAVFGESGDRGGGTANSPGLRRPVVSDTHIYWDMSGLEDGFLSSARSLRVSWRVDGGPVDAEDLSVYFDNVRVSSSVGELSGAAIEIKQGRLRAEHGTYRYEAGFRNESFESGRFVYSDGYEVDVEFETVSDNRYLYSIGNDTYRMGSGW